MEFKYQTWFDLSLILDPKPKYAVLKVTINDKSDLFGPSKTIHNLMKKVLTHIFAKGTLPLFSKTFRARVRLLDWEKAIREQCCQLWLIFGQFGYF